MRDVSLLGFSLRRFACYAVLACVGLIASLSYAQPSNLLGGIDPTCLPQMHAAAQECRAQIKTEGQSAADIQTTAEQCITGKLSASCKALVEMGKKKMQPCHDAMRSAVEEACKDKTGPEYQECAKQIVMAELNKSPECRAALTK